MKRNRLILLSLLQFIAVFVSAQQDFPIRLKSGAVRVSPNIKKTFVDSLNARTARFSGKSFVILQFEAIPSESTKKMLAQNGIELLDYIPENAYTATISGRPSAVVFANAKARAVFEPSPEQKMEPALASGIYPGYAVKIPGTVDVWIRFAKSFDAADVLKELKDRNIDLLSSDLKPYQILSLRLATQRLREMASLPFIEYVQAAPSGDQTLNFNSRTGSRAGLLNASVADGGRGLNGEGVVVGIGDNSDVQTHADFTGRLINRAAQAVQGHGTHTTGTMAGAGNINARYRGYAPEATIVSQAFGGILVNAPAYVNDYGMVVTNNSYGDNIECSYHGTYDLYSAWLDQMAFDLPNLTNVFAAGNSGGSTCSPFSPGYHTVLGGYQSAKNVISVGATSDSGALASFSSRGPVKDGRIKPEITAMGQSVYSTFPTNTYGYNNGTSMAAPAVSGGVALLVQRYRQLNSGADPENGLVKALLCNGAADRGNSGPDFKYGFGWMNLLRSVDMLEQNHFVKKSISNGGSNTENISVPANTAQLKVILYWNDPAASPLSAKTLVNDLDLEVSDPSSSVVLPKILDTANANLEQIATNGADHSNNMEQVVIDNPAAGNYSLVVKVTVITQNPSQQYFLVYDIVPAQIKVTAPVGGETLVPGVATKISWDATGFSSGTVSIEFSTDGGGSWGTVASGVDVNRTIYKWVVPAGLATDKALIRITKDGSGETDSCSPFIILGQPTVSLAPVQCEGYINISWTAVTGATDYEVMMLDSTSMTNEATTTTTSYSFSGLSKAKTYWVSVRPRVNGKAGMRAVAISRLPNSGICAGTISDNDLKLDAILAPVSGRRFTSSQLSATTAITARIKNLDDAAVSSFDVMYSINGSAFVTEHVSASVGAGGTYNYTFTSTADMSAPADYNLVVVVKNANADPVSTNDTAYALVRHVDNQPIDLTTAFVDDMETAAVETYQQDTVALNGLDRYDFSPATVYGRLRTFVNSGIAYSGSKTLTLDADRYYSTGNTNYLTGTYNLSNYDASTDDVRLDFEFNNHSQYPNANNKVWIRGSDADAWIEAYDLDDNQADPGIYKKTVSIEVSDLLAANGQALSPSFQVRWGQWGQIQATDRYNAAGYSFDDIRLYEVFNDIQMLSIDEPVVASCGLTSHSTIKVTLRNSSNSAISNIPVKYRINNGSWVTETIASLAGNATEQYSFTTTADLSALSSYTIEAVADLASDSFHDNDSVSTTVINSPVINSFPYLENFEQSDGHWYTGGVSSSWQYGTPSATKIRGAANGAKAWKTNLTGNYNDLEQSYLYSPCFDLSGLTNPTLSFSLALDLEDCGSQFCDGAWVEYSSDGVTWNSLGALGQGTNWYNRSWGLWSIQDYTRWHVATIPLPAGVPALRLRFVMSSDPAVNREGVALDDIHIYDNTKGIYDGVTMSSPVSQTVSGNNWIDFTSGGKLIASLQPNNQNMGATDVQAYLNSTAVRYNSSQYYLDRNITVKPANAISDSVTVRFYFLDSEAEALLNATGCSSCSKPASVYELGVSKYSDPDRSFENGNIGDDQQGIWNFMSSDKVAKVPFDKGYYAEFKVADFSEFWLNNGGIDKSMPLPVKLLAIDAQKLANDVQITWKVATEQDVDRYEIELARGNTDVQSGHFEKIGEVPGLGNTVGTRQYSFTDKEADKFGARYYRLKIINADGSFSYSPVRSVVFADAVLWQVYPNPSHGNFSFVYQLNINEVINATILDAKGSIVKQYSRPGNGFLQKLNINLTNFANGVYLLQVDVAGKKQTFKLFKH